MNSRIKELRKALKLKQKDFGSIIGLRSSISEIENGTAPITERTIIAICSKFHVSEEWLRKGHGDMFIIEDKKYNEFFEIYNNFKPPLQEFLICTAKDLLNTQRKL